MRRARIPAPTSTVPERRRDPGPGVTNQLSVAALIRMTRSRAFI
jgi:hypothetical protein